MLYGLLAKPSWRESSETGTLCIMCAMKTSHVWRCLWKMAKPLTSRVHLSLGAAYGRSDGMAESLVGSGDSAQKLHGQERQGGRAGIWLMVAFWWAGVGLSWKDAKMTAMWHATAWMKKRERETAWNFPWDSRSFFKNFIGLQNVVMWRWMRPRPWSLEIPQLHVFKCRYPEIFPGNAHWDRLFDGFERSESP